MDYMMHIAKNLCLKIPVRLATMYLLCRTFFWFLIGSIAYFVCSLATGEKLLGGIEAYITYTVFWTISMGLIGGAISLITKNNIE